MPVDEDRGAGALVGPGGVCGGAGCRQAFVGIYVPASDAERVGVGQAAPQTHGAPLHGHRGLAVLSEP